MDDVAQLMAKQETGDGTRIDTESEEEGAQAQSVFAADANEVIKIKVVSSTGEEVHFKVKRTLKLRKLQNAYANKVGKDVSSIRFLYDGERIHERDTPASLDMEDDDTIDVVVEQIGGSSE